MSHIVYNLTSSENSFQCAGYTFTRVANYDAVLPTLFRRQRVTKITDQDFAESWHESQTKRPGVMAETYHAVWNGPGDECVATIHRGSAPLIYDVLLLWSLWGGEYACMGQRPIFESPTFYGYNMFQTRGELVAAIDKAIAKFKGNILADELGLFPGLFLLLESMRTETSNYQTLFLSPVIDLLSGKEKVDPLPQDEANRLNEIKKEIDSVLEKHKLTNTQNDQLWRNVLKPFSNSLNSLGKPAAADKLKAFLSRTPALRELSLSTSVIESHARAFNKFRNAMIHYAGFPDDVYLSFGSGRTVRVKRNVDRDQMFRALIYYTHIFRDMLILHFTRISSVESPWGEQQCIDTLRGFFVEGLYNNHDWVAGAFKDYLINNSCKSDSPSGNPP